MSEVKTILIVGRSVSVFRNYLKENGYKYIILTDKRLVDNSKKYSNRVLCDFTDNNTIDEALSELKSRFEVHAAVSIYENYINAAAYVCKKLNLPGMPEQAAEACTDKKLMRQLFSKAPKKISPAFKKIDSEAELLEFANMHGYPLIIKPANLAKSLLVTKSSNEQELINNYRETTSAIADVYKKYAPYSQPSLLAEEFMEGPIHSVDAFIEEDGTPHVLEQVVDYQTGYDIGFDDNFHYSRILPSKLPADTVKSIRETAAMGCQALSMKASAAHVEIILTKNGPMIVEIGARNGGYRSKMHGDANGIDITGNLIKVISGQKPQVKANRNDNYAVLEIFPKRHGLFSHISNASKVEELDSLVSFKVKVEKGQKVGKAANGFKMCSIISLHNKDLAAFNKDLEFIRHNVEAVVS